MTFYYSSCSEVNIVKCKVGSVCVHTTNVHRWSRDMSALITNLRIRWKNEI